MLETLKKPGFMLTLACSLALGGSMMVWAGGCSGSGDDDMTMDDDDSSMAGDDDDSSMAGDDDSSQTGDDDSSPSGDDDSSPSGDDDSSPSGDDDSTSASPVTVTFTVDTNYKVDGTNRLAEVLTGESLYMVGAFNSWTPLDPANVMYDDGTHGDATAADGIWTLQLTFPYKGGGKTWNPGDTDFQYKFVKTKSATTNNEWGNGPKDYVLTSEKACPKDPSATAGLWQIEKDTGNSMVDDTSHNIYFEHIPTTDTTVNYIPDAFEDYAHETFGLPVCDG